LTDDGVFVVGVQNEFARSWLEERYSQRLSAALRDVDRMPTSRADRRGPQMRLRERSRPIRSSPNFSGRLPILTKRHSVPEASPEG
jgi:chromosomal replication initiation ATPase DnaA